MMPAPQADPNAFQSALAQLAADINAMTGRNPGQQQPQQQSAPQQQAQPAPGQQAAAAGVAPMSIMDIIKMAPKPNQTSLPNYGLGPMTQATQAGSPQGEISATQPSVGQSAGQSIYDIAKPYVGEQMASRVSQPAGAVVDASRFAADVGGSIAMQPVRAGEALADATADPSLANVTNAGKETALTFLQPGKALAAMGAGFGIAAGQDLGLDFNPVSSADARPKVAELPGLSPDQQSEYALAVSRINKDDFKNGAERRFLEATTQRYQNLSSEFQKTNMANAADADAAEKAQQQQEYNTAVSTAKGALDKELSRDVRFADSNVGKIYDAYGGAAAIAPVLGFGAGALSRAATGPGVGGIEKIVKKYLLPGSLGAVGGVGVANAPQIYDARRAPAANPEKAGYQAYARELPPTHPRKQEFADYAAGLPDDNPVATAARKALSENLFVNNVGPALEGAAGGWLGADAIGILGRARRRELGIQKRAPETQGTPGPDSTPGPQGALPGSNTPTPPVSPPQTTSAVPSRSPHYELQSRDRYGRFGKIDPNKVRGSNGDSVAGPDNSGSQSIAGLVKASIKKPRSE